MAMSRMYLCICVCVCEVFYMSKINLRRTHWLKGVKDPSG
jgi:hypothetical protein